MLAQLVPVFLLVGSMMTLIAIQKVIVLLYQLSQGRILERSNMVVGLLKALLLLSTPTSKLRYTKLDVIFSQHMQKNGDRKWQP